MQQHTVCRNFIPTSLEPFYTCLEQSTTRVGCLKAEPMSACQSDWSVEWIFLPIRMKLIPEWGMVFFSRQIASVSVLRSASNPRLSKTTSRSLARGAFLMNVNNTMINIRCVLEHRNKPTRIQKGSLDMTTLWTGCVYAVHVRGTLVYIHGRWHEHPWMALAPDGKTTLGGLLTEWAVNTLFKYQ